MSRCPIYGVDEHGKRIPYRCRREAGHDGPCAMEIDVEVTRDEAKVRPAHYKLIIRTKADHAIACGDQVNLEIEAIDVIEALGFENDAYLTTALIYLLRLGRKDESRVEVKKAIWWLQRWLTNQEKQA